MIQSREFTIWLSHDILYGLFDCNYVSGVKIRVKFERTAMDSICLLVGDLDTEFL